MTETATLPEFERRLFSLQSTQEYKDFQYTDILNSLDSLISEVDAVDRIDRYLKVISKLVSLGPNILNNFFVTHVVPIWCEDEYGNGAYSDSDEIRPMTDFEKHRIFHTVMFELGSYGSRLEKLKTFIEKNEQSNVDKELRNNTIERFRFEHETAYLRKLQGLLASQNFIGKKLKFDHFKAPFCDDVTIYEKIEWRKSVASLKFFIKKLFEPPFTLLEPVKKGSQWLIVKQFFAHESIEAIEKQPAPSVEDSEALTNILSEFTAYVNEMESRSKATKNAVRK